MTIRTRLLAASFIVILLPLAVLSVALDRELERRVTASYEERLEAIADGIVKDVELWDEELDRKLDALVLSIRDDNRFRVEAMADATSDRSYMIDYCSRTMPLMGLDLLSIRDRRGEILSSGHERYAYYTLDTTAVNEGRDCSGLMETRREAGSFVAYAAMRFFTLGDRTFIATAGIEVNEERLAMLSGGTGATASLRINGRWISPDPSLARTPRAGSRPSHFNTGRICAMMPGSESRAAVIHVGQPRAPLEETVRAIRMRLYGAVAVVALGAVLLAASMSVGITRPIRALAATAKSVDLDTLDTEFPGKRGDEVGTLGRLLGEMMGRLRVGREKLRDTERRATIGEMARQVNHDVRNGITPLRNVFRHLSQLSSESPEELPAVFAERAGTVDASLGYLEELAADYGKLTSPAARGRCDLMEIVRDVASAIEGSGGRVTTDVVDARLELLAEPVGLRRIVENLARNGMEAMNEEGELRLRVFRKSAGHGPSRIILEVTDSGEGIPDADRPRIFDRFHTTKESGSGLGLAIVRRLVTDFEGTIEVESVIGEGSTFRVFFPEATEPEGDR